MIHGLLFLGIDFFQGSVSEDVDLLYLIEAERRIYASVI